MWKTIGLYGLALAAAAFALEWLEYRYFLRTLPTEIYVAAIAVLFACVGAWTASRLVRGAQPSAFERNDKAARYLGISAREAEVLELLAEGLSNKQIARRLAVSPNTVKTHVARLYEKLGAERRTQAVQKARELSMLP